MKGGEVPDLDLGFGDGRWLGTKGEVDLRPSGRCRQQAVGG